MLRLPDAVLQHIVSLAVTTTEGEDEKKDVLQRIKCTSKAMKGIAKAEATRVQRAVATAFDDLFEKIPTFPMFKELKIELTDQKPVFFQLESPQTKCIWLMVYLYKESAKIWITFASKGTLMECSMDITPYSARSGFIQDFKNNTCLGYNGALHQVVEDWLRSCTWPTIES